jgi:protein-tyrosine phosphatase
MSEELMQRQHLDLEGAYNIRDLGGYSTCDGGTIRWNMFLRADGLENLTPESQAALVDYGVRTVIDLRNTSEIEQYRDVFEKSSVVTYFHQNMIGDDPLPIDETLDKVNSKEKADQSSLDEPSKRFLEIYKSILDHRSAQVIKTLDTIASSEMLPALVHCAAGKDRTGIITALVLGLVGVPEETIVKDYALTAFYLLRRDLEEHATLEKPSFPYTIEEYQRQHCAPETMIEMLQHLKVHYGGIEGYVLGASFTRQQINILRTSLVE